MSTVNASGGDGLRVGFDDLIQEEQTQEAANQPNAVADEAATPSTGETLLAQTPFQLNADYRRFLLDEQLRQQTSATVTPADVAMDELVTGTNVRYTFNEGPVWATSNYRGPFVRYLLQEEDGRKVSLVGSSFETQYRKPGTYRVTFEVTNQGQPPEFYLLRQVVRDPADRAREALLRLPGTTVEPELFLRFIDMQIGAAEQRLSELQRERDQLISRGWLNVPQYMETRLNDQIRQLEDGLEQLRRIKQDAPVKLFGGATGPVIPLQAALIPTERPQPVPLQLYAKPLGNNRWAIVDFNSPSNARVYGNFRWDSPETALDLLSIVGGFAGAGGGVGALLRRGTVVARTAEGASLTFRSLGDKYTLISQGIDQGAALVGGVIIANVWLEQLDSINRSNYSPEEKQRRVGLVLQQAAMMGGVIVVGGGISRFARLADDEVARLLRGANFDSELEDMIRTTPGLQRALQEQGADRLRELYQNYKAGGVNRNDALRVTTFLEYVSSNGVPTRVERIPQSLTEALSISDEGLRRMTARALNETMLARTEPELLAAFRRGSLPPGARAALDEVLARDLNLANAPNFARARGTLSEALNARLGESITNVAELRRVLSFVTEPASRGSIGEYFYQSRLMAGGQLRKREFNLSLFGRLPPAQRPTKSIYPDFLRTDSRRTLDVKTGYPDGDIELEQINNYNRLVNFSQSRNGGALRSTLEGMGVVGGRLDGHDFYVARGLDFLPDCFGSYIGWHHLMSPLGYRDNFDAEVLRTLPAHEVRELPGEWFAITSYPDPYSFADEATRRKIVELTEHLNDRLKDWQEPTPA